MGGEYNKKNKEHNLKANKIWLTTLLTLSITVIIFIIILKVADIKIVKFDDSIKVTNESIKYIEDTINNYTFTFIENDKKDIVKFSDFEVYTEISNESKEKIEKSFIVNLENIEITFNIDALAGKIESLNKNRLENKYSSIKRGENYFVLEEEIIGNKLDTDNLYKELKSRLEMLCCLRKNTNINITINLYDYYVKFNNNNIRQSEYEKELSKIENTYIEYTNGYRIELKDLYEYLIVENDKIILDKNREKEYKEYIDKTIETELLEYDTVGIERNFKTTKGDTLKTSGGT